MKHLPQQSVYVVNPRLEVRRHLPAGARSVVDVGCGPGGFGQTLREAFGDDAHLVGVEAVPAQASRARAAQTYDEILEGYFPESLEARHERFDLVTFNDVLEHMWDPWSTLEETHAYLNPGGHVLATIPSIQYAPVLWRLVRGRWDYVDSGTLDRTHVRFFTRATITEMFETAGYVVESCEGINSIAKVWSTDPHRVRRILKLALASMLGDARYLQFVVVAREV